MNKVSIIMPSYNAAKFIAAAIQSVIEQTYSNWELLITDDCSKDDTINIIKKFQEIDNRIQLFSTGKIAVLQLQGTYLCKMLLENILHF